MAVTIIIAVICLILLNVGRKSADGEMNLLNSFMINNSCRHTSDALALFSIFSQYIVYIIVYHMTTWFLNDMFSSQYPSTLNFR